MTIAQTLLAELTHEMISTRKVLERIPADKLDWMPHPKSMTVRALASHIAEIPGWTATTLQMTEFHMDPTTYKPWRANSVSELLEKLESEFKTASALLNEAPDSELFVTWTMTMGGQPMLSMPRVAVLRGFVLSHLIHHRAQLALYLRLLDVAVPSIYGPSADER